MTNKTIPLIGELHDLKFVSSFIPCGVLILESNEDFTILEANEGYFNLIGYSKEELRDLFQNSGTATLYPEDRDDAITYFKSKIDEYPNVQIDYACRIIHKIEGSKMIQFGGKAVLGKNDKIELYFSLMDLTSATNTMSELQREKDFNSLIASLTEDIYFDYDLKQKSIRFSENFANKLCIPHTIENFPDSNIAKDVFGGYKNLINDKIPCEASAFSDGEIQITLPTGEKFWYLLSYKKICDETKTNCKIVGKMTDITRHKTEIEFLKIQSETDRLTGVYNKIATEQFIYDYLSKIDTGTICALLIIDLDNFKEINDTFGHIYGDKCLKEVGNILSSMFRNVDIVGRIGGDEFFVFIKDCKNIDIVKRKSNDICNALKKTYSKNNVDITISASVGISLFPEHGTDFNTLYEKADNALYLIKKEEKNGFSIYCPQD